MRYVLITFFCVAAAGILAVLSRPDLAGLFLLGAVVAAVWRAGDGILDLLNQYRYRDYPPEMRPKSRNK
jgi:hypothetical protein